MDCSYGAVHLSDGFKGQKWDILGQTYVPLHVTESSFALHAIFPPGTFVPLHLHEEQDEFVHVLEGQMEIELNGELIIGKPGAHVTMPRRVRHALFNRSDKPVVALIVAAPMNNFYSYMQKIDGMTDRQEMARLAAEFGVPFL